MRVAVVGHVEHVSLGYAERLPEHGGIVHLDSPVTIAGGGGGVSFAQLVKSPAEAHFFTAFGNDAAAREVSAQLAAGGGVVHAARREAGQTRDVVLLTPDGERTIVVLGQPLHPTADDALPFELFAQCDAVYFTAQDPRLLVRAREARLLVVSARRRKALVASGVRADVVVGSRHDAIEASTLAEYPVTPGALVMTRGAGGGDIETATGIAAFRAPASPTCIRSSYGAGDSFAAALVYYLAAGVELTQACERAGSHGAAVLASTDTLKGQLPLPKA